MTFYIGFIEPLSVSFLEIQIFQESRFRELNNYRGSENRKITKNDCQTRKTQMAIGVVIYSRDTKWLLYNGEKRLIPHLIIFNLVVVYM